MTYTKRNTYPRITGKSSASVVVRPTTVCVIVFKLPTRQKAAQA